MYKKDHMSVLRSIASSPRRAPVSTKEIVEKSFKKADNADRVVRNAYRLLRENGHIEIAERGRYKITTAGLKFVAKADKEGYNGEMSVTRTRTKKAAKTEQDVPKRRGRPPKAEKIAVAPKKRGRPSKSVSVDSKVSTPKRRGRPPKAVKEEVETVAEVKSRRPRTRSNGEIKINEIIETPELEQDDINDVLEFG